VNLWFWLRCQVAETQSHRFPAKYVLSRPSSRSRVSIRQFFSSAVSTAFVAWRVAWLVAASGDSSLQKLLEYSYFPVDPTNLVAFGSP